MRFHHQNHPAKEGTPDVNQVEEDLLQAEATRAKCASSGSKAGATGGTIANSNTKGSLVGLGEQPQPDQHHRMQRVVRNRRKKSRSTSRSKSPKSPKSPKGSPRSKAAAAPKAKASPAAVCLIASLLATMSQASPVVCCPAFTFSKNVVSYEVEAEGNLWPIGKTPRTRRTTYPVDYKFTFDPSAAEDAALQARMLAGAVGNELKGVRVECKYCCDTEFGCDCCIPKNLVAMPAERRDLVEGSIQLPNVSWIYVK